MVVTVEVVGDDDYWQMVVIGNGDDGCCGGGDWIGEGMRDVREFYEATRAANTLEAESHSQNGNDGDNGNDGNGNGNHGGGGNNRNENPNENGSGAMPVARRDIMKLMTEVYFPRNEIKKMETELWNLTVKNNDLAAYTQIFQELTLLCTRMVQEEEDRIESYGCEVQSEEGNTSLRRTQDTEVRIGSLCSGMMVKNVIQVFCMKRVQTGVWKTPRVKYRVPEVVFWVKKGFSAYVSAGSGSGGSIRCIQLMDMVY
ncbi:putative reverse transcriptase domain-containing protein [Tanacetum coccineum]